MDPVPNGFKGRLTINTKVATFVGPANANLKTYYINFDRSVLAKYVTLQRIGEFVTLEINEVTMIKTPQNEQGDLFTISVEPSPPYFPVGSLFTY